MQLPENTVQLTGVESSPSFAYTTGLSSLGHPELIISIKDAMDILERAKKPSQRE